MTNRIFPEPGVNPESGVSVFNPDVAMGPPKRDRGREDRPSTPANFSSAVERYSTPPQGEVFTPGAYSEQEVAEKGSKKIVRAAKVLGVTALTVAALSAPNMIGGKDPQGSELTPAEKETLYNKAQGNPVIEDGVLKVPQGIQAEQQP